MAGITRATRGIFSYFTRHRTAANLVLVAMVVAGLAAMPNMRAQYFPDVILETISVSVGWDGAGAEDVDNAIVSLLEPALLAVEGVDGSTARATEGRAVITLSFEPGRDMAEAADAVEAAVSGIRTLPAGADDPQIRRANWRDGVTDVVLSGPVSVDQLARFSDELVVRLFAAGVTRTSVQGLAAPQVLVEVPAAALVRHDVTMSEIGAAIGAAARTDPVGDVSSGAARVRAGTAQRSPEDIAALVLRRGADGATLTLGDVAHVRREGVDRARGYFVGENPAMMVRVERSAGGDAIGIQRAVEAAVADLSSTLPEGVTAEPVRSRADEISGRLALLIDNALIGLALVVALLFLFLNARTAFWVAAGIPVAMIAAVAAMYAMGLTFNMISLFALIITLGIVVDDAIVVGEHADYRARHLGEGPAEAAESAAARMAAPVFSATITTVIAFFALVAIGGRFGELIKDIPLTVIAVLVASLVECFIILPHHMRHALAHTAREHWYDWPSRQVNRGFRWVRGRLFRPAIKALITARYPVLALTILALSSQAALFVRGDVQWRFFNAPEQGRVSGNFAMLPGATRADTLEMMRILQRSTAELGADYAAEHGLDPLKFVIAEVGGGSGRGLASADTKAAELLGGITIELIDPDLRPYSSSEFVAALQQAVPPHPMLEEISFRGWRSGPGGDALSVQFFGGETAVLKAAAEDLKTALLPFAEVSAVEDSLAYDKQDLILQLTPQGQALGFSIDNLGRVLRDRLNGIEAASFPAGPRTATVRVELAPGDLAADFMERTMLRSPAGQYVPLADIASVEGRQGFSTIRRQDGLRIVSVTGDIAEDDPARATEIMQALQDTILPGIASVHGVDWRLDGLAEQERAFLSDALTGFILCLIGIYLVLAWIFASWTRPMVVMAVIPFGLVGAIWGHAHWGIPFSMFSVVGLIGMTGIIINDSIVLVTTVDDYARRRGLFPAIVDAAADRLRPVLLTTLTTVLGLSPLLYEGSSQAEFLKPTVITLIYGLGFGMVLVLVVVPALLAVGDDVGRQMRALGRSLRGGRHRAPRRQPRRVVATTAATIAALFAATLGAVVVTGTLPAPLARLAPGAGTPAMAFALFVAGAAVLSVLGFLAARILAAPAMRRPGGRR